MTKAGKTQFIVFHENNYPTKKCWFEFLDDKLFDDKDTIAKRIKAIAPRLQPDKHPPRKKDEMNI